MTVQVEREQDVLNEAVEVLMQHMPPHKVVRVLSAWQVGSGDYTKWRKALFAGETVDSLVAKVRAFERERAAAQPGESDQSPSDAD